MLSVIERNSFRQLFSGNENHYGVTVIPKKQGTRKDGKKEVKSFTVQKPVTAALYDMHLDGEQGLGIVPIDGEGLCSFCAIDLDEYADNRLGELLKVIYTNGLPFNVFRSKSGGLHLYMFLSEKVPAKDIRAVGMRYMDVLGLDRCEFFPKQDILAPGDSGNWINLPYFNYEKTERYLYDYEKNKIDFPQAMLDLSDRKFTFKYVTNLLDNLPLSDAPPCLQYLYISGGIEKRNDFLFDLATYLKCKYPGRWQNELLRYNLTLDEPLPEEEISNTIIKSHEKNTYSYRCKNTDQEKYCRGGICRNREYGKATNNISKFSFEKLIQVQTKEPYYIWKVNGHDLVFYTEAELYDQNRFILMCMRHLIGVPNPLKRDKWNAILDAAISQCERREIDADDDITPSQLLLNYTREFVLSKSEAKTREQILMDRVFRYQEEVSYVFKAEALLDFLRVQKNFRLLSNSKIYHIIKTDAGAYSKSFRLREDLVKKLWFVPYAFTEGYDHDYNIDIDFNDIADDKTNTGSEDY